jgi:hypothetical protein
MEFESEKKDCRNAMEIIQKSLDDPLTPEERASLDRHLASCGECGKALEEYRALSTLSKEWIAPAACDPGDQFTRRVMSAIASAEIETGAKPVRSMSRARNSMEVWGALCALAGLMAVAYAYGAQYHIQNIWNYARHIDLSMKFSGITVPSARDLYRWMESSFAGAMDIHVSSLWIAYIFIIAVAGNIALIYNARGANRRNAA